MCWVLSVVGCPCRPCCNIKTGKGKEETSGGYKRTACGVLSCGGRGRTVMRRNSCGRDRKEGMITGDHGCCCCAYIDIVLFCFLAFISVSLSSCFSLYPRCMKRWGFYEECHAWVSSFVVIDCMSLLLAIRWPDAERCYVLN